MFHGNTTAACMAFVGLQLLLALRHPAMLSNFALGQVCLTSGANADCNVAPPLWHHGVRMRVATVGDGAVDGVNPIDTLLHNGLPEMDAYESKAAPTNARGSQSLWDITSSSLLACLVPAVAHFVWAYVSVIISMYLLAAEQHFWRPVCAVLSLNFWCVAAWLSCAVSPAIGAVLVATAVASRRSMLLFPAPSGELSVTLPSALPWQCGPTA